MLLLGAVLLAVPVRVAGLWPWSLTALTGRAVGAWLVGLGIIAVQSWHANSREATAIVFPATTVYAALQLAVLAGFASSIRWAHAPAWGYLLLLASLLAVGVVGWAVTARGSQHITPAGQAAPQAPNGST